MFPGSNLKLILGMNANDREISWYPGKHLKLRYLFVCMPAEFCFMNSISKLANMLLLAKHLCE